MPAIISSVEPHYNHIYNIDLYMASGAEGLKRNMDSSPGAHMIYSLISVKSKKHFKRLHGNLFKHHSGATCTGSTQMGQSHPKHLMQGPIIAGGTSLPPTGVLLQIRLSDIARAMPKSPQSSATPLSHAAVDRHEQPTTCLLPDATTSSPACPTSPANHTNPNRSANSENSGGGADIRG
ncbi:hypothetical protein OPQ81_001667 [Rhizoctonia solani]|nr:hypothetical protein OPQ81_001667 [Rhizoctonia solani]